MRLKELHLQGFKTFAPRTDLQFGEGLTAIVGPNGSGKSNIADAVRWVLGEQSLSQLRAKRTEDLIFAGSSNRAPLGMAEVSITIDNADRLLPLDFAEVTLTRRAYRSGENEYYINKSKVRLRDVLEVASSLGQAYTVVGQGLIDAALSLRPEERRELFEEAAAIRGYFVQREDALKRLARTDENVTRVSDLAAELEPQVRRLERQARQTREYATLEADLHSLMRAWYAARRHLAEAELGKASTAEVAAQAVVEARRAEMEAKSARLREARAQVWELVEAVSALHEQRAQVQARHAARSQAHAVLLERLSAAGQHTKALQREQEELAAARKHVQRQMAILQAEVEERVREVAELEGAGREVSTRLAALDAEMATSQAHRDEEAVHLDRLMKRLAEHEDRQAAAERAHAEQERAAAEAEARIRELGEKVAAASRVLEERHAALLSAQQEVADAEQTHSAATSALTAVRAEQSRLEGALRDLRRRGDALGSQVAALAGEQQASLHAGVRAVVSAARDGRLGGYVGTVAELLQVPPELETAVEAALGGRLQEVVMARWADAERAIEMLKQSGAGRATFLPLDTLKASPPPVLPSGTGIVGRGIDLVEYDGSLRGLAESLLGRLLIVEDLPSARSTLARMSYSSPWTMSTLGGEVVRPGGSVTGGSNVRADDTGARGKTMLSRERKRRELMSAREALQAEVDGAERTLEAALVALRQREEEVSRAAGGAERSRRQQAAIHITHMEQQGLVSRLQQELSWRAGLLSETRKQLESLKLLIAETAVQKDETGEQIEPRRRLLGEIEERLRELRAERSAISEVSGSGQTRLAVLSEALRNTNARQEELRKEDAMQQNRGAEIEERARQVEADTQDVVRQIEVHKTELTGLASQLTGIETQVGHSEQQVRELEAGAGTLESEQATVQAALVEAETLYSRAAVERQRCAGVLDSLRIEISEELGEEDPSGARNGVGGVLGRSAVAGGATGAASALLALDRLPSVQLSHLEIAELERRVRAMKGRLARIGPVNALALEEHAALAERHDYLEGQLADLTSASEGLRRVIGELDRAMREQFTATFDQVNAAFQHFFSALFAGGTARLELTAPEDVTASGVEILAQPPGKRMQPLAALSGGERALTSAALLFALLKVRPVPFCVFDEVDAALDESNVTRFRALLRELGTRTQFAVITHNRGTIEAADTLYGVSMSGDGTSQLLSLKVS